MPTREARKDEPFCRSCGIGLIGSPIDSGNRHLYGGATHFRKEYGYYTNDMTAFFYCADCGFAWHRFYPSEGYYDFAVKELDAAIIRGHVK